MSIYVMLSAVLSGLVPLSVYFLKRKSFGVDISPVVPFLFLLAVASLYELVFSFFLKVNVTVWFRIYIYLEFVALFYFFKNIVAGRYSLLFYFYGILTSILFLYFLYIGEEINNLTGDSYLIVVEMLFVYTFSILYFKEVFDRLSIESLWERPEFYFISGLILYFSGTFFLFLLSDILYQDLLFSKYWVINIVLGVLLRALITLGVWKAGKI